MCKAFFQLKETRVKQFDRMEIEAFARNKAQRSFWDKINIFFFAVP